MNMPINNHFEHLNAFYRMSETKVCQYLLDAVSKEQVDELAIKQRSQNLIKNVRQSFSPNPLDELMQQYQLSSNEGIALMCLAEALIRIPDKEKKDGLIRDKLSDSNWQIDMSAQKLSYVLSCGLSLTGNILSRKDAGMVTESFKSMITKLGRPIIRQAVTQAIKILGNKFVLGQTIHEALKNSKLKKYQGYVFSYDMLGEAALTHEDAKKYFHDYMEAISVLGHQNNGESLFDRPGISIKLSALYPRYELSQSQRAITSLTETLIMLTSAAREANISLTVDAEESSRLEMSLKIFNNVLNHSCTENWDGFGLAVQAYQKRAHEQIKLLREMAKISGRKICVRLVKGAYWDTEIKDSQVRGLKDYPVFTRKEHTDLSYLACAKELIKSSEWIYPQFATHNAYSVSYVQENIQDENHEFQCLHGMGEALYDSLVSNEGLIKVRMYAPVGSHKDLLPYLVRRLIENGANTSFINHLTDKSIEIESMIQSPIEYMKKLKGRMHHQIPLPSQLFSERTNSQGKDLSDMGEVIALEKTIQKLSRELNGECQVGQEVINPSTKKVIGFVEMVQEDQLQQKYNLAHEAYVNWKKLSVEQRSDVLIKMAENLERSMSEMAALAIIEAGKSWQDAIDEVREAIDFLRYYATQASNNFKLKYLNGPTGELNTLDYRPYGIVVCISPWNFPLAIFLGQISAALVMGNAVIAKPAHQTPLIAKKMLGMMLESGLPENLVQLLPGDVNLGKALVNHPKTDLVMLTGSTQTAKSISMDLAKRPGPITPLIAETGGQNVMIVDSSALPEQVVKDIIQSSFQSAGQRCSALRVLYVQDDIADKVITMLKGAMDQLVVGNPVLHGTDIGPIIDQAALDRLNDHQDYLDSCAQLIHQIQMPSECLEGFFFMPCVYEIKGIHQLKQEVFGPILHLIRYQNHQIDQVIDEINSTGYGLTFGIHSRVPEFISDVCQKINAGNHYINRNMIGAVVGVQPFGGHGLSGTGPKAGGPHYLAKLCLEVTYSDNITAIGGNTELASLN